MAVGNKGKNKYTVILFLYFFFLMSNSFSAAQFFSAVLLIDHFQTATVTLHVSVDHYILSMVAFTKHLRLHT